MAKKEPHEVKCRRYLSQYLTSMISQEMNAHNCIWHEDAIACETGKAMREIMNKNWKRYTDAGCKVK